MIDIIDARKDDLAKHIDYLWPSFLDSFPPQSRRTKEEMYHRLIPGKTSEMDRILFYATEKNENSDSHISLPVALGVYHIDREVPFCYGEYVWTVPETRKRKVGTLLHAHVIKYLRQKGINDFICEGHEDNPWHHKIGLGKLPINYLQPAISEEQNESYMIFLVDVNLGGKILPVNKLVKIVSILFRDIYNTKFVGSKSEAILIESIGDKEMLEATL